jgi:hypothetical protein
MTEADLSKMLLAQLGIADRPPLEQEIILSRLNDQILRRATLAILEKLSVDEREKLTEIISQSDDDEVFNFLRRKLGIIEGVVHQAAGRQIDDFLNGF